MKFGAWILLVISAFTFCFASYKIYEKFSHPLKFEDEIVFYADLCGLSPELIASVINVESSFKENAKSNKNAIGLMQVKLSTANYINTLNNNSNITEKQLFEPAVNIKYGCEYLKYLINKFEDINTSLAAYNAGETRVKSWLNSGIYSTDGKTLSYIPYKETKNYVEKINKNVNYYKKLF